MVFESSICSYIVLPCHQLFVDLSVTEYHLRQCPPPPLKPKPVVACKPQQQASHAVNIDDDSSSSAATETHTDDMDRLAGATVDPAAHVDSSLTGRRDVSKQHEVTESTSSARSLPLLPSRLVQTSSNGRPAMLLPSTDIVEPVGDGPVPPVDSSPARSLPPVPPTRQRQRKQSHGMGMI